MMNLAGKISDFIRSGRLPKDVRVTGSRPEASDVPSSKAVRRAKGQGLGNGATRRRSDRDAK